MLLPLFLLAACTMEDFGNPKNEAISIENADLSEDTFTEGEYLVIRNQKLIPLKRIPAPYQEESVLTAEHRP